MNKHACKPTILILDKKRTQMQKGQAGSGTQKDQPIEKGIEIYLVANSNTNRKWNDDSNERCFLPDGRKLG